MNALPFAARAAGAVLGGAPNFRDLGGCDAQDGMRVRHGRVYRSGHLGELKPEDIALLRERLGASIRVIDLRGVAERASAVCAIPGAAVHSLAVEPSVAQRLLARIANGQDLSDAAVRGLMCEAYRNFTRHARPQFAGFFRHLLDADTEGPLVLHCTAGKDRTGFAAAMLLEALGVPRAQIMDDYLHTQTRVRPRSQPGRFPPAVMRILASVETGFLEAAYAAIEAEHGGIAAYQQQALGLGPRELAALRGRLLEPAPAALT